MSRPRRRRPSAGRGPARPRGPRAARATRLARNLPYGDQRRLEIARALAVEPQAAAARRARRGHEPQGDEDLVALISKLRERAGADDPAHRARHEGGHGDQRPHHRPGPRREDRRGHARTRSARTRGSSRPTWERRPYDSPVRHRPSAPAATDVVLRLSDVHTYYGAIHALQGIEHRGPPRRDRHPDRRQRRRQDHHPADHLRPPPSPRRGRWSSTGKDVSQRPGPRARRARHRARARGPADLLAPHGVREPADGRLHPLQGRERASRSRTSTSCSRGSRSATPRRAARSPAASSRCSPSAGR